MNKVKSKSKSNETDEQKRPIGLQTGEFKTTYGIYAYYDLKKSDWLYVGLDSHIDQNKRNREHMAPSNYNKQPVNRTLQKDTEGRYVYNVIEINIKTYDDLRQSEKYYERLLQPKQNFAPCGGENPMKNPEVAQKVSDALTGHEVTQETKDKISDALTGKPKSKEHCKKISDALTGENNPMYGKIGKDHHNFDPIIKIRKYKDSSCKQGFIWRSWAYINGKQKFISSTDLKKCIEKVVAFLCNDELNIGGYTGWEVIE